MKTFIAKEFLWLLLALVIAIPLSFLWLIALDVVTVGESFEGEEKIFVYELWLLAYVFSFVGVYLVRLVAAAVRTVLLPKPAT